MFLLCPLLTSHLINNGDDLNECVKEGDILKWASLLQTVFLSLCFPPILRRPPADQLANFNLDVSAADRSGDTKTVKCLCICVSSDVTHDEMRELLREYFEPRWLPVKTLLASE